MHNFILPFFINCVFYNAALFYPFEDEQSSSLHISARFLPHDNTVWLHRKDQWV
jgi:hypothetical protein